MHCSRNCCLFRLKLNSSPGMMFKQLLQPGCWRISFALIWSLDIFFLVLLRLVFSALVLSFLMLFLITEIFFCWAYIVCLGWWCDPQYLWKARWGVVTAIPTSLIGRAMSSLKSSKIVDSPMMAGMKWFLRTSSIIFILFCIVEIVRLRKLYLLLKSCIYAE